MIAPELLHCPFCAGSANLVPPSGSIIGKFAVTCALCGATVGPEPRALGVGTTERQVAISKWNHRTPSPQEAAPQPIGLRPGQDYTHGEITALFKPTPRFIQFVLTHSERIVALRVREDYNPYITGPNPQIWVGASGQQPEWGRVLAQTAHDMPVFVQRKGSRKFTSFGHYRVKGSTTAPSKLTEALKRVPHKYGLSRIVYLEKID